MLTTAALLGRFTVAAETSPVQSPNIVLIISDDQTYSDFGFMGNPHVHTPHLDRLASHSARYVNGYVPSSVCRPSLVTLLTGLYPHQHGVHFNHPPPGFAKLARSPEIHKRRFDELRERATYLIRSVPTLPRRLASSGYRCLQTGKYWEGHWRNAGFTEGMTIAQRSPGAKYGNLTLAGGDVVAHGNGDHGLAIGRETMQPIEAFLDDCGEQPFFVWYAPFLPHTPHDAPPRFTELFADRPEIPAHRKPYYASIAQFDETVGQLVESIERRGLSERTIFLFVVDNGWEPDTRPLPSHPQEFAHTKRSKRAPFDAGLRTPILIRFDSHVQPATHEAPVSSIDIVPTLLEAAGLAEPIPNLPGRSLWPSATGRTPLQPRPVFGEIYPGDATTLGHPSADIAYRWVRDGPLKLIVPHRHNSAPPWNRYVDHPTLFDLSTDPQETRGLSSDPNFTKDLRRLHRLLDAWWLPGDDSTVPKPED